MIKSKHLLWVKCAEKYKFSLQCHLSFNRFSGCVGGPEKKITVRSDISDNFSFSGFPQSLPPPPPHTHTHNLSQRKAGQIYKEVLFTDYIIVFCNSYYGLKPVDKENEFLTKF